MEVQPSNGALGLSEEKIVGKNSICAKCWCEMVQALVVDHKTWFSATFLSAVVFGGVMVP